jgi:hypothetical protein
MPGPIKRESPEMRQPPQRPQHVPTSPFYAPPPLLPFGDAAAFEDAFVEGSVGDERLLEAVELRAASANFPRRHAAALIRTDSDTAAHAGRPSVRSFSAGAAAAQNKHQPPLC